MYVYSDNAPDTLGKPPAPHK